MGVILSNNAIRVGLLGGSFNPAHEGHLHISLEALRRLGLHQVWWLVTPQNPLKPPETLAPLEQRVESARRIAHGHTRIIVTDMERALGTIYTCDTLEILQQRCPRTRFVWLMGADNLIQFHRWHRWQEIFRRIPVAIFDRSPFTYEALVSEAVMRFGQFRVNQRRGLNLPLMDAPAWSYMHIIPNLASSTLLREETDWLKPEKPHRKKK